MVKTIRDEAQRRLRRRRQGRPGAEAHAPAQHDRRLGRVHLVGQRGHRGPHRSRERDRARRHRGRPRRSRADDGASRTAATARAAASSFATPRSSTAWSPGSSQFGSEVTRVALEVGGEGKLGAQARVQGVMRRLEGPHRLGEPDGVEPDVAGPRDRARDDGGRAGRPDQDHHDRRQGRDPRAQEHDEHDGRAAARVRERGDARRSRGRYRRPPRRSGDGARRVRRVARADRVGQLDGEQPDVPGPQHRRGDERRRRR